MSPLDYAHTDYSRAHRQEPHSFAQLPFLSKAVGIYLRTRLDPVHGWLELRERTILHDLRNVTTGPIGRRDQKVATRAIGELLDIGYLVRCTIIDKPLGSFTNSTGSAIPLSPWREDATGNAVVIKDWVPSEHGLTPEDTERWHAQRREAVTLHTTPANVAGTATAAKKVAS